MEVSMTKYHILKWNVANIFDSTQGSVRKHCAFENENGILPLKEKEIKH